MTDRGWYEPQRKRCSVGGEEVRRKRGWSGVVTHGFQKTQRANSSYGGTRSYLVAQHGVVRRRGRQAREEEGSNHATQKKCDAPLREKRPACSLSGTRASQEFAACRSYSALLAWQRAV